ncbi:MAG: 4-hydroxy-tetrahydrodipicolinate synthase, partial [bacterium]|nr:4-hydroxy-tetrahydrodipicolinate synthase [bacterium]
PESLKELIDRVDNIVTIKEATGSISNMMRVIELCGDKMTLLSGDDNLLLPVLSIGGSGVVSVVSNLLPGDVKNIVTLYNNGSIEEAKGAFYRILPVCKAMFLETNPIPVKAAMEMLGYCSSQVRLPLVPLSDDNKSRLKKALIDYGVEI